MENSCKISLDSIKISLELRKILEISSEISLDSIKISLELRKIMEISSEISLDSIKILLDSIYVLVDFGSIYLPAIDEEIEPLRGLVCEEGATPLGAGALKARRRLHQPGDPGSPPGDDDGDQEQQPGHGQSEGASGPRDAQRGRCKDRQPPQLRIALQTNNVISNYNYGWAQVWYTTLVTGGHSHIT